MHSLEEEEKKNASYGHNELTKIPASISINRKPIHNGIILADPSNKIR
jgi:hypothetical protein